MNNENPKEMLRTYEYHYSRKNKIQINSSYKEYYKVVQTKAQSKNQNENKNLFESSDIYLISEFYQKKRNLFKKFSKTIIIKPNVKNIKKLFGFRSKNQKAKKFGLKRLFLYYVIIIFILFEIN